MIYCLSTSEIDLILTALDALEQRQPALAPQVERARKTLLAEQEQERKSQEFIGEQSRDAHAMLQEIIDEFKRDCIPGGEPR